MNKVETLGRIAEVEAQIKELGAEREALRLEAVKNGWARWEVKISLRAPSLAWWKEHRPATWEKHAIPTKSKKFTTV